MTNVMCGIEAPLLVESRLQRSLRGGKIPGALPQACKDAAPLVPAILKEPPQPSQSACPSPSASIGVNLRIPWPSQIVAKSRILNCFPLIIARALFRIFAVGFAAVGTVPLHLANRVQVLSRGAFVWSQTEGGRARRFFASSHVERISSGCPVSSRLSAFMIDRKPIPS
jgi:hypothetical protein